MIKFEEYSLTKTKKEDLDFVLELEEEGYPNVLKWKKKKHEASLSNEDIRHLIIKKFDKNIGYCIIAGFDDGNDSYEIKRLVIKEKNKGLGRKTINAITKYLFEEQKAHRVWLDYHEFNDVGAYLYKDMGFVKEGVLRESLKYNGKYYDVIVMSFLNKEYKNR